jgi:hypothetical protein
MSTESEFTALLATENHEVARPKRSSVPRKYCLGEQTKPTNSGVRSHHRVDAAEMPARSLVFQTTFPARGSQVVCISVTEPGVLTRFYVA